MPESDSLSRFRTTAIRYTAAVSAVLIALALIWSRTAALGVAMGALGGLAGFWIIATRLEGALRNNPENANFAVLTGATLRFAIYGIVLVLAYLLDRDTNHGLFGALAGILSIRVALLYLGVRGSRNR